MKIMDKKICIVTGANRGIGRAIAEGIAEQGHKVILVCRNEIAGKKVLNFIQEKHGELAADLVIGDLSSITTTKTLAENLLTRYPHFNVLIHNVGIWLPKLVLNEDGLEKSFMVNYLALYQLTLLLLSRLKENTPSRVVLVNAELYTKGNVNLEVTPWGGDFSSMKTYMNTKLCGMLFMRKLAIELEGTGVTTNAVHPGVIRTGLLQFGGFRGVFLRSIKRFFASPEKGARGPLHLALSDEVTTNGSYYNQLQERTIDAKACDEVLANQLWELSRELCNITKIEK